MLKVACSTLLRSSWPANSPYSVRSCRALSSLPGPPICSSCTRSRAGCVKRGMNSARGEHDLQHATAARKLIPYSQEHGLELNAFFEPHVAAWLKDTESNTTQDWVSRAVGMDSVSASDDLSRAQTHVQWVPEGENKHSQSVIDLFEFIRGAAQVILHDLPLGEYRRAMYLVDLAKVGQAGSDRLPRLTPDCIGCDVTVRFDRQCALRGRHEPRQSCNPDRRDRQQARGQVGWKGLVLACQGPTGRQVDGKEEGRRRFRHSACCESQRPDFWQRADPQACVKLTDMGAAQICLDDLVFALEAEDTARIVKQNKPPGVPERSRHIFSVTIMRGEGILNKSLGKGADGFVTVTDAQTGERLIKTRTVLGQEDPRWCAWLRLCLTPELTCREQSFEVSVGQVKTLELTVFDRTLVGKHDGLGTATFRLDPRSYAEVSVRDVLLPLTPRGNVHVRISMEGGEKHDVAYHLQAASRALDRTATDMIRQIVDKMSDFIKSTLSPATLMAITKPLKDKKKPRTALSEEEIERSLGPLFAYFNENVSHV